MSSSVSLAIRLTVFLVGVATTTACAAPATAAPAATTRAAYPLKTCVVSGGKLGGMGKPVEYVHKQAGQADRSVIFCCKGCIKKFEKEPTKYLAKLDAAGSPATAAK